MLSYLPSFFIINRFLEDTCVIVTVAFLLSRASVMPRLFSDRRGIRDRLILGAVFAVIGASEFLFPGDRYPYVPYTLAIAFAGYACGLSVGIMAAFMLIVVDGATALAGATHFAFPIYVPSVVAAAVIGAASAQMWQWRRRLSEGNHWRLAVLVSGAFIAGALAETFHAVMEMESAGILASHGPVPESLAPGIIAGCVAANGFGCLLLALVLQDAHERSLAQQQLVKAERELAALRTSQLNELHARLHPHFLFNALAAIAGLCVVDPRHAEKAVADLASLLRQFLRSDPASTVPLCDELETVHTYLSIEKLRLGERIGVTEQIPSDLLSAQVPRFSLQVPVENAVQHGVAERDGGGQVRIIARRGKRFLLLAVCDNGSQKTRKNPWKASPNGSQSPPHGLGLLAARLRLAYGGSARVRLLRFAGRGTLCAIRIPLRTVIGETADGRPTVASHGRRGR